MEDCLLWEGPHTGAGEECEESFPEEEGAAETTCGELTTTPIPRVFMVFLRFAFFFPHYLTLI